MRRRTSQAFTRIELVAVVAALAALGLFALPLLAASRASSDRAACFNNLRQIMRAALMYADDNNDAFPPRQGPIFWPRRFLQYYGSTNLLTCPADGPTPMSFGFTNADGALRSYVMNGWADYYAHQSGGFVFTNPMPISVILEPAQTIVFGEKRTESGHFWMDYFQGDDYSELEQSRHFSSKPGGTDGASQYAFADGSVRLLKYGQSLYPTLLWAVEPEWRTNMFLGP
jgi:prepilin-type processing-associated H-X9-DG protein